MIIFGLKFSKPDGTRISGITIFPLMDKQARATCPHCDESWDVFELANPSAKLSPESSAKSLDVLEVLKIVETVRTEEMIGDDLRTIDNSGTATSSLRRLRAARRWTQKFEIQIEHASTTTHGLKLGVGNLAGYEYTVQAAVRQNYAIGAEEEQTFEEEIEVTVPPHTMVQLRLHWKRLWQEGYVVLADQKTPVASIPFRSVIGITFDQESVDS